MSKITIKLVSAYDVGINSPDIFGVMGRGDTKLIMKKTRCQE